MLDEKHVYRVDEREMNGRNNRRALGHSFAAHWVDLPLSFRRPLKGVVVLFFVALVFFCVFHRLNQRKVLIRVEKLNGSHFWLKLSDQKSVQQVEEIVREKEAIGNETAVRLYLGAELLNASRTLASYALRNEQTLQLRLDDELRVKIVFLRRSVAVGAIWFGATTRTTVGRMRAEVENEAQTNGTAITFLFGHHELGDDRRTLEQCGIAEGSRLFAIF
ncbi:hypothetical protein M3Y99_01698300 [Aphelenchoides fujianensis]|nr:hypothetical protein M3Y99_01698300 [Aphelenchoides fujianensis]